jgi:hypothetical protein
MRDENRNARNKRDNERNYFMLKLDNYSALGLNRDTPVYSILARASPSREGIFLEDISYVDLNSKIIKAKVMYARIPFSNIREMERSSHDENQEMTDALQSFNHRRAATDAASLEERRKSFGKNYSVQSLLGKIDITENKKPSS